MNYNLKNIDTEQFENYESIQHLGSGITSNVYRVRNNETNKEYALKILHIPGKNKSKEFFRFLRNELRILKKLKLLKGFRIQNGECQVLLELVPGRQLDATLNSTRDFQEANRIIKSAVTALQELHSAQIAHCDAHTRNFLVADKCKAIDFGYAIDNASKVQQLKDYTMLFPALKMDAYHGGDIPLHEHAKIPAEILYYYAAASYDYIKQNKAETAFKVLSYGALTIAGVYGLSYYAAARVIATQVVKTYFLDGLNRALQDVMHVLRAAQYHDDSMGPFVHAIIVKFILIPNLIVYLNHNSKGFKLAFNLMSTLTSGRIPDLESLSAIDITGLALLYYPISTTKAFLQSEYDVFVRSQNSFMNECASSAYAKPWFSSFNLFKARSNETIVEENIVVDEDLGQPQRMVFVA